MCGIQTKLLDLEARIELFEFRKRDQTGNTVMTFGIKEAEMKRKVSLIHFIMTGQHVKGMSKVIGIEIAVPSPRGIRVRKMPVTGTVETTVVHAATYFMTIGIGMGMDAGAVPGNSKTVRVNEAKLHGRSNGCEGKKLLQSFFIVEREVPFREGMRGDFRSNTVVSVGELFAFAGFGRRLLVFIRRKQVFTAGHFKCGITEPKPVDEIKVRAKWRESLRETSDKDGE